MNELEKLWAAAQAALASGAPRDQVEASVARRSAGMTLADLRREVGRIAAQRDGAAAAEKAKLPGDLGVLALKGLSMGWMPELAAAGAGRDLPKGFTPEFIAQSVRDRAKEASGRAGLPGVAAEIAGGLPTTLLAPGGAARSVPGAVARAIGTGAVTGAVAGAGYAEPGKKGRGATIGAGLGAATGLPFGLWSGVARAIAPSAEGNLLAAIESSPGGMSAVSGRAAEMAPRGGVLADLSPQLRREADFAATFGTTVRQDVGDQLAARQSGQAERLAADLRDALRTSPVASRRLKLLEQQRRAWAASDKGYGGLPDQAVEGGLEFLNQPKVRDAVAEAQQLNLIGQFPNPTPEGVYTFNQLQHVKRRLDGAVSQSFRRGDGDLGNRLAEVRDELVKTIEASNKGYEAANATYKALGDRERALVAGHRASQKQLDPAELADLTSQLAPEALQEFRYGLASGLRQQLQSAKTNRNVAQRIVSASAGDKEMLRLIFDNEADLSRFLRNAKMESDMAATLRQAFGGSQTAPRSAMREAGQVASGALSPWRLWQIAGRVGLRLGSEKSREGMANKMAPYLFGDELPNILAEINRKAAPGAAARAAQSRLPAVGGFLFGRQQ